MGYNDDITLMLLFLDRTLKIKRRGVKLLQKHTVLRGRKDLPYKNRFKMRYSLFKDQN